MVTQASMAARNHSNSQSYTNPSKNKGSTTKLTVEQETEISLAPTGKV